MPPLHLCRFRHALGRPGIGVHAHRLLGVAVLDVAATVAVALLLARLFRWSAAWTVAAAFLVAVLVHRAFCVNTAVNVALLGRV